MKKLVVLVAAAALSTTALVGCDTKEDQGTAIGAIIGAGIGSRGNKRHRGGRMVAGALIGGLIGKTIGKSMDANDQRRTQQVWESAPTGQPTTWQNPDTGNTYTATPTRTFEQSGQPCREFTLDGNIGGRMEQVYGTACRQNDGSWKVIQ